MSPRSITLSAEIYVRWPSCSCYPRHSLQKHHLPPEIRKNRTEPLSISILRKVNWSFFHFSFFSYFLLYSFTSSRANCDRTLPNTCLTIILTWRIAQIDSQTHSTTKQLYRPLCDLQTPTRLSTSTSFANISTCGESPPKRTVKLLQFFSSQRNNTNHSYFQTVTHTHCDSHRKYAQRQWNVQKWREIKYEEKNEWAIRLDAPSLMESLSKTQTAGKS